MSRGIETIYTEVSIRNLLRRKKKHHEYVVIYWDMRSSMYKMESFPSYVDRKTWMDENLDEETARNSVTYKTNDKSEKQARKQLVKMIRNPVYRQGQRVQATTRKIKEITGQKGTILGSATEGIARTYLIVFDSLNNVSMSGKVRIPKSDIEFINDKYDSDIETKDIDLTYVLSPSDFKIISSYA